MPPEDDTHATEQLPPAPAGVVQTAGYKKDVGKLRLSLIPPKALEAVAYVYTIGAEKYDPHNWLRGMAWSRVLDALYRHLIAWQEGRSVDPDDGQHPLASVVWCALTLMEYERLKIGIDDRASTLLESGALEGVVRLEEPPGPASEQ